MPKKEKEVLRKHMDNAFSEFMSFPDHTTDEARASYAILSALHRLNNELNEVGA